MSKIKTRSLLWKESFCYDLWLLQLCLVFLLTCYRKLRVLIFRTLRGVKGRRQNNNLSLTTLTLTVLTSQIKVLFGMKWLFLHVKYLSLARTLFSPSQGQYLNCNKDFLFLCQLLPFPDSKGSVLEPQNCPHSEFTHPFRDGEGALCLRCQGGAALLWPLPATGLERNWELWGQVSVVWHWGWRWWWALALPCLVCPQCRWKLWLPSQPSSQLWAVIVSEQPCSL